MPRTHEPAPDYIPKEKQAQWESVYESAYRRAVDDGKSEKDAASSAFAQATSVINKALGRKVGKKEGSELKFRDLPPQEQTDAIRTMLADLSASKLPPFAFAAAERKIAKKARKFGINLAALVKPGVQALQFASSPRYFATCLEPKKVELAAIGSDQSGETIYEHPIALTGEWVKGEKFSITLADLEAIERNFSKRGNGEVNVDYDHASENPTVAAGGPIPSAGRIVGTRIRAVNSHHVLFGHFVFTPKAKGMIADKEYRFISPAIDWAYKDKKSGEAQGATLTSVALTNKPFLDELPALQLRETYWTTSAVLMTDLGGNTMSKEEQIAAMKLRAADLEKDGKGDEAKKLREECASMEAGESPKPLTDKHPKLKLSKLADGAHKGHHGVYLESGEPVGFVPDGDMKSHAAKHFPAAKDGKAEPDEDDKKLCEFRQASKLTFVDVKSLIDKGREAIAKEAKVDGKKVLCTEAVVNGVLDMTKATFVANEHREITTQDFIAVKAADDVLAQAVRDGKLAPTHRKELFVDVVADPEKWKKLFASSVPLFSVDRAIGIPGATDGTVPTAEDEVNAKTKQLMIEKKIENFGDAMRIVLSENPELAARQQKERPKA